MAESTTPASQVRGVEGGRGAWTATSGTLTLDEETPVYAAPDKYSGAVSTLPAGDVDWDKYEILPDGNWYSFVKDGQRYEIVLREENAEDFISRFCEGEKFDSLYLGVLSGAIRFVEQGTDTNKARWQSSPFWLEFLKGIESIKLKSHEVTTELGKTIDWIDISVLRSLKLLSKVAKKGDIDLYQIIENSNKGISERHKMLFNSFDLLTEEKNDIFDKIKAIGLI